MELKNLPLKTLFEGWEGYNFSLIQAVESLSSVQIKWRPRPNLRPIGEIVAHISLGRIDWFARMEAPGSKQLAEEFVEFRDVGSVISQKAIVRAENAAEMARWLELSWVMVASALDLWTAEELLKTYPLEYKGKKYAVSFQWTLWRVLSHDIHHGGEISLLLGLMGLPAGDLGDLGGHLIQPPLAPP